MSLGDLSTYGYTTQPTLDSIISPISNTGYTTTGSDGNIYNFNLNSNTTSGLDSLTSNSNGFQKMTGISDLYSKSYGSEQNSINKSIDSYMNKNTPGTGGYNPDFSVKGIKDDGSTKITKTPDSYDWAGTAIKGFQAFTQWQGLQAQKGINKAIIADNNRKYQLTLDKWNDHKAVRKHNAAALGAGATL